jgi:hypothetical protein
MGVAMADCMGAVQGQYDRRAYGSTKFGTRSSRPINNHQREKALERLRAGDAQSDVARTYGVDPAVICRLAKLAAPSAPAR